MRIVRDLRALVSSVALALSNTQIRFRRRVATWVTPKPSPEEPIPESFYSQQPTCQIPHLQHLFAKFFGERESGFYVEVGAYDGIFVSNTWGLAERGWDGLLIEPVPHLAELCRKNYVGHERVRVIQKAVGASASQVTLHLGDVFTTANTDLLAEYGDISWASGSITAEQVVVECQALDQVLSEENVPKEFDLLVVDVEGFETEVFAGFDLARWRPKMLIVELVDTHPNLSTTQRQDARLGRSLASSGYVIAHKDWINTVFVREDVWRAAFGFSAP